MKFEINVRALPPLLVSLFSWGIGANDLLRTHPFIAEGFFLLGTGTGIFIATLPWIVRRINNV